jgi:hypothetical protein
MSIKGEPSNASPDLEEGSVTLQELYHTEAYRVRTVRGTRGEHAMDLGSPRRPSTKDVPVSPVLPVEDYEVRALIDVKQRGFVILEDFKCALFVCMSSLGRGLLSLSVW